MVHLHETIQTTVAPLSALKDNLEHLHQKIDSLENTIDERASS
jgi:prefoldin subunit 5